MYLMVALIVFINVIRDLSWKENDEDINNEAFHKVN